MEESDGRDGREGRTGGRVARRQAVLGARRRAPRRRAHVFADGSARERATHLGEHGQHLLHLRLQLAVVVRGHALLRVLVPDDAFKKSRGRGFVLFLRSQESCCATTTLGHALLVCVSGSFTVVAFTSAKG